MTAEENPTKRPITGGKKVISFKSKFRVFEEALRVRKLDTESYKSVSQFNSPEAPPPTP